MTLAVISCNVDILSSVLCAVGVAAEEVNYPVVYVVGYIELGQFLQKCSVPYGVKRLAEVKT